GMTPSEQRLFQRDMDALQESLAELKERLNVAHPQFDQIRGQLTADTVRPTMDMLVTWLRSYISLVQELSLVQARARVEAIVLDPLEIDASAAFRLACTYRLDL